MKNLLIVTLALAAFISCKKEDAADIQGTHIFWFDKSTSDSLLANGFGEIHLDIPNIVLGKSDLYRPVAQAENWYAEAPPISSDVIMVRIFMEPGQLVEHAFQMGITPLGGSNGQAEALKYLVPANGKATFIADSVTYTKLEWKP